MADPIIGKISVGDGATFTPSINGDVLTWSNNKNLPNPESLDIVGATFTPAVSNAGVLSWTNNKGLPNPPTVDMAQAVVDKKPGWGIPIGYEYFTFNPNIPQGALPLFGGEYSRTTYSDLWAWVQTQTGYLKTEAEWQTLSTSNNGNVPYYSDGDGSTTFRVPSLKCWVKAADGTVTEVGSYKAAGLPNITGSANTSGLTDRVGAGSNGALSQTQPSYYSLVGTGSYRIGDHSMFLDASLSNSIYGNSTTVQPESVVGLWLVQAYGVVVDTGQINEQQYIDDRMATRLPLAGGTMTGNIAWAHGEVGYRSTTHTAPYDPCRQMIVTAGTVDSEWNDGNAKLALRTFDSTGVNTAENGGFDLLASDGTNSAALTGRPGGSLKWTNKEVITKNNERLTLQYVSNSVITSTQFNRNYAWISNGFLFVFINMDTTNGATTSDVVTVGKILGVNIIVDTIDNVVEQNSTHKAGLICLYNNGSNVDIRIYCQNGAGGGRIGKTLTIPLQ